jgi:excisionase family DNA binding protein
MSIAIARSHSSHEQRENSPLFQIRPATKSGNVRRTERAPLLAPEDASTRDTPVEETVLNIKEAADFLRCHPRTLQKMAIRREIPAKKVGSLWRFSRQRLQAWMQAEDQESNLRTSCS